MRKLTYIWKGNVLKQNKRQISAVTEQNAKGERCKKIHVKKYSRTTFTYYQIISVTVNIEAIKKVRQATIKFKRTFRKSFDLQHLSPRKQKLSIRQFKRKPTSINFTN